MTRVAARVSTSHSKARGEGQNPSRALPSGYLKRSELPLASLILLLPFIILYEVGTRHFATDVFAQTEHRIIAFKLMQDFFWLFGATGKYLPALAIVGILMAWHIARNDPWQVRPGTLLGMMLEGAIWGLPLLVFGLAAWHYLAAGLPDATWQRLMVLSIGAGIYEELVFRLVAFTLLSLLLSDLLQLRKGWVNLAMVLGAAAAFSVYHYLGTEQFQWQSFAFRTVAGVYFGLIFLCRGFGITALAHASYDVLVVLLKFSTTS
jgi:hypothetical protein